MLPPPPSSTLFPYTTLFRSGRELREKERASRDLGELVGAGDPVGRERGARRGVGVGRAREEAPPRERRLGGRRDPRLSPDRKSTRLNSSHPSISYAVFCLKK